MERTQGRLCEPHQAWKTATAPTWTARVALKPVSNLAPLATPSRAPKAPNDNTKPMTQATCNHTTAAPPPASVAESAALLHALLSEVTALRAQLATASIRLDALELAAATKDRPAAIAVDNQTSDTASAPAAASPPTAAVAAADVHDGICPLANDTGRTAATAAGAATVVAWSASTDSTEHAARVVVAQAPSLATTMAANSSSSSESWGVCAANTSPPAPTPPPPPHSCCPARPSGRVQR
jgi:hypothetical protein